MMLDVRDSILITEQSRSKPESNENNDVRQCDQMLKLKVGQIYPKLDPKSSLSSVYFKGMSF